jgi:hypothetical protein
MEKISDGRRNKYRSKILNEKIFKYPEVKRIVIHLENSTGKLDEIVSSITKTIERGERGRKRH